MAVAHAVTAEEYAGLLADPFLLMVLSFLDLTRQSTAPKKEKNLYPTDPLLAHLPRHILPGLPVPDESALAEAALALELFRTREAQIQEAFGVSRSLLYWKSAAGKEIDFLSGQRSPWVAVESKYAGRVAGQDRLAIRDTSRRGLIASRDTLDLDDVVRVIPAPIVLALLG
jgi:predicted AAA+ superfamily ATPase